MMKLSEQLDAILTMVDDLLDRQESFHSELTKLREALDEAYSHAIGDEIEALVNAEAEVRP